MATASNPIPTDAPFCKPSFPSEIGASVLLGVGATKGGGPGIGWRSCTGRPVGEVVVTTILGAPEGSAEGALVGSDVDGIAVSVGSDVMVGRALPVGYQVAVGTNDKVGKMEREGDIVDDEGEKDAEGEAEKLGEVLLLLPIEGANDGANDDPFEGEGANDVWLFGASD